MVQVKNKNFIDTVPNMPRQNSKTKIGKDSWCFNNHLLCKPEYSSAEKILLFLLRKEPLFSK